MDSVAGDIAKKLAKAHLKVVAIENFEGQSEKLPQWFGARISDSFSEALEKNARDIRILHRSELVKALEEQKWLAIDVEKEMVFRLIAKQEGAQAVIGGKVSDTGSTLKLFLSIVNLGDGKKPLEVEAEVLRPELPKAGPEEPVRDPSGVYLSGFGVTAPRCRYCPPPDLSKEPPDPHRWKAQTILMVTVTTKGHAEDIRVIQSAGTELDEKAVEAVKRWYFFPATLNSSPVAGRVDIEVTYDHR